MNDVDDIDIYGDLASFGEKSTEDCAALNVQLKSEKEELEKKVLALEKELTEIRALKNTLEVNLSSLIKTAKTEIARKDRMIAELREKCDNKAFRRDNYRIPKLVRPDDKIKSINTSSVPTSTQNYNSTQQITKEYPAIVEPIATIISQRFDDDDDDEDFNRPNYLTQATATVFGQRLLKRIQNEKSAANLQKEHVKLPIARHNVQNNIKKEDGSDVNREINPVNIKQDENSSKKSIKRPNEDQTDVNIEKRQKLDLEAKENITKNAEHKNITEPEMKINNSEYFCPIKPDADFTDTNKVTSSVPTKNEDDRTKIYTDDKIDNRRSRRTRPSRWGDICDNRNKYPSTRSRTLQDRREEERAESRRNDDKKPDSIRDSKERNDKRRESQRRGEDSDNKLRERDRSRRRNRSTTRINNRRLLDTKTLDRQRGGSSDSSYKSTRRSRSKERVSSKIESSSQPRRYSRDRSRTSRRSRSRERNKNIDDGDNRKSKRDAAVKETIDSEKTTKIQIIKLNHQNKDNRDVDSLSVTSLEDGEIPESPSHVSHQKVSKSTVNIGKFSPKHSEPQEVQGNVEGGVDHLLDTLSKDFDEFEPVDCDLVLRLTPVREEKIENIEAFIRESENTRPDANDDNSIEKDDNDVQLESMDVCNTTKDIVETLAEGECVKDSKCEVTTVGVEYKTLENVEESVGENESGVIKNSNKTSCKTMEVHKRDESGSLKTCKETDEQTTNVSVNKDKTKEEEEEEVNSAKTQLACKQSDENVNKRVCSRKDEVKLVEKVVKITKDDVEDGEIVDSVKSKEVKPIESLKFNSVAAIKSILAAALLATPPKRQTIPVNNVDTNYASILSKYPRKKKNSTSNDAALQSSVIKSVTTEKISPAETKDTIQEDIQKSSTKEQSEVSKIPEKSNSTSAIHEKSKKSVVKPISAVTTVLEVKTNREIDAKLSNGTPELDLSKNTNIKINIEPSIAESDVKSDEKHSERSSQQEKRKTDEAQQNEEVPVISKTEIVESHKDVKVSAEKIPEISPINDKKTNNIIEKKNVFENLKKSRRVTIIKPVLINNNVSVKPTKMKKNVKKLPQIMKSEANIIKVIKRKKSKQLSDSSSSVTLIFSAQNIDNTDICGSTVKRIATMSKN